MTLRLLRGKSLVGLAAALMTASCGADSSGPVPAPTSPPATSAEVAPPPTSTATSPAPPAESVPLFLVADGFERRLSIHPLEGGALIVSSRFLGELGGDGVVSRAAWVTGAEKAFDRGPVTLGGRFPDSTWLAAVDDESIQRWSVLSYRFRKDQWAEAHPREGSGAVFAAALPWTLGRVVALRDDAVHGRTVLEILDGPAGGLPEPAKLADGRSRLVVQGGASLASGEIFAFGVERGASPERLAVERWAPGKPGMFDAIPLPQGYDDAEPAGIFVRSATDAYLAATAAKRGSGAAPVLARFDGASWTAVASPMDTTLNGISGAPDGTLCVIGWSHADGPDQGEAWCRPPSGAWKRLALPESAAVPHAIWARSATDVWVAASVTITAAGGSARHRVYRTIKPPAVFHAPPMEPKEVELEPFVPPSAGSASCPRLFALIFPLTMATPIDYDFPSTRKALVGHTEFKGIKLVEAIERGRRYFGAEVPSYDVGNKLVALVKDKVAGAKPALLCRDPRVRREIAFDPAKP